MHLTDIAVRTAQPRDKTYKLTDGAGLVVLANPNGSNSWRLRYRFGGREKMLALGTYPQVGLRQARDEADQARRLLIKGRDPSYERLIERTQEATAFEVIAKEWLNLQAKSLSSLTLYKARWMIESFVLPHLGKRPLTHAHYGSGGARVPQTGRGQRSSRDGPSDQTAHQPDFPIRHCNRAGRTRHRHRPARRTGAGCDQEPRRDHRSVAGRGFIARD